MFGGVAARSRAISSTFTTTAPTNLSQRWLRASQAFRMAPPQKRKQSGLPGGYVEDHSKGAMLRFEDSLPRLPVPTLDETAERYLKSVHPLLSPSEFEITKKAVDAFVAPDSLAHELQKRLIARRDEPDRRSWIIDWWNEAAYLGVRDPVVPYVSYFYSFRDDRKRRDPAKRAAAITTAALEFKRQVDEKELEPEYMKKLPMAMSSYEYMFNTCRVPARGVDYANQYPQELNQFIIAIRKNQFFKIPHHVDGKQLTTLELEQQFKHIYQAAEASPGIGILTSENRDIWADMRDSLIKINPANQTALETIEAASFVVCLDDASPVTLEERSKQFWHGNGTNRWYDKPCQFVINDNGSAGFMGEHSMMDGTPTHRLSDTVNALIFGNKLDFDNPEVRSNLPPPTTLRFHTTPETHKDIATATADFTKVIGEHELRVEAYQGYGKGLIKRFKCSPDAYVQMIIQLAYHKFYGKNRPTYESAATRRFQRGRTETCRTVSDDSVAFTTAMSHPLATAEECRELLLKAIGSHVKYITNASDGKGVDRHLFGLKKLIKEGEELPDLYKDPAFSYSSTWYVSSSQLSSEFFNGYGWSQVVDEGWGIAYMINEYSIQFNIVSKHLGCERMAYYVNEAANDMRDIMLPTIKTMPKL